MIRTFIALPVSEEVKSGIAGWQDGLKREITGVSWVKPGNIHITLKFLGDIREEQADDIIQALSPLAEETGEISLKVEGQGVFPNPRRPRVLWTGLTEGADKVKLLAKQVDNALAKTGFEREKRGFKAHLTVGRVRRPERFAGLPAGFTDNPEDFGEYKINELIFMRSQLDPKGSIYTPIKIWQF